MNEIKIAVVGIGKGGNAVINHLMTNSLGVDNIKYIHIDDRASTEKCKATHSIKVDYIWSAGLDGKRELAIARLLQK